MKPRNQISRPTDAAGCTWNQALACHSHHSASQPPLRSDISIKSNATLQYSDWKLLNCTVYFATCGLDWAFHTQLSQSQCPKPAGHHEVWACRNQGAGPWIRTNQITDSIAWLSTSQKQSKLPKGTCGGIQAVPPSPQTGREEYIYHQEEARQQCTGLSFWGVKTAHVKGGVENPAMQNSRLTIL